MTLPTGSQNLFNLITKNTDPDLMKVDFTAIEKQQVERRAADAKANPTKPEPARQEFNKLNNHLFNLKQNAKAYEQRVNNEAGTVRLLEDRLNTAIKEKKQLEDAGNLMGARTIENQIQGLENELADTRQRLVKEQRWNAGAARELRTWQQENGARLKELQQTITAFEELDEKGFAKEVERHKK